jgi:hypothetical protein
MTPPVPPSQDIGPAYKILAGCFLLLGLGGVIWLHAKAGAPVGVYDFGIIAVLALFCLALWRPDGFDGLIKTIADKVPFLSFTKTPGT